MIDNFALIVGAAKSGTTSLFHYLAEHPEIASCSVKEPNFFTDEGKLSKGWDWYQDLWSWDSKTHKIAVEASTSYTKFPYFPNAAERISTMPARFRFIYVMRNPLERIESHYGHGQITEWETTKFEWNKEDISEEMINTSRYAQQISEYYKRFSSDCIKLVIFEDLVDRKAETLRDICQFLDVDPTFEFRKTDRSYNRSHDRITDPSLRRMTRSPMALRLKAVLPYSLKKVVMSVVGGKGRDDYRLSPESRERTLERLAPDLEALRNEYGIDIKRWGINI